MYVQSTDRILDAADGGVDWAQVFILGLQYLTSRQHSRERVLA